MQVANIKQGNGHESMPGRHQDDVADCQNRFRPETSARREFELIRLLTEEGTEQMRRLWLRKCSHTSNLNQHAAGQPSHRRAAANPSQLQPRHRPCPSRRRPPSSRLASAARSGSTRSTSPARCGLACASPAGCWRGSSERALATRAALQTTAKDARWRSTGSSSGVPLSG